MRKPPKRILALVGVGLASYLVILLADFPASLAWSLLVPAASPVTVRTIHGTIWQGRLEGLSLSRLRLQKLVWSLDGWALLGGHATIDIRVESRDGTGSGAVSYLGPRHWSFRRVHAVVPLEALSGSLAWARLRGRGTLHLMLRHLIVDGPELVALVGTGSAAKITLESAIPVTLADVQLAAHALSPGTNRISFRAGPGGSLLVTGHIRLEPDHHWSLTARLKPATGANPAIGRLLSGYGSAGPDGYYTLHFTGDWPSLSRISPAF